MLHILYKVLADFQRIGFANDGGIQYFLLEEWERLSRAQKLDCIEASTVVVKSSKNFFKGSTASDAQQYFDRRISGSEVRETPEQTMLRLGLDPRSSHQVVGKYFFLFNE